MERRNVDIDRRCRQLAKGKRGEGPVVYWMSRDQRVNDNWALLWAQQEALIRHKKLEVVFCLTLSYPGANLRHYSFLIKGLEEVQEKLKLFNIGFKLLPQSPDKILADYLEKIDCHLLVSDFDPLKIKRLWKDRLQQNLNCPVYESDTHNVIPAWTTSEKKEYAAHTIRPKINRILDDYLTDIPSLQLHPFGKTEMIVPLYPDLLLAKVRDRSLGEVSWIQPGETAAQKAVKCVLAERLPGYSENANDPCLQGQSDLSPYLHFGQLSAQRLAWLTIHSKLPELSKENFLEQLIVRKELADNFCYYEKDYDTFAGFPEWAQITLNEHKADTREFIYSYEDFDKGRTHEPLWNSCQNNLCNTGKLHGYLRMYWAKKILEWTTSPETALAYTIALNDRYSLDGRDPNGYTGIAWSIGGVHDRAWRERNVFGKIRYMNAAGCRRKFAVDRYISLNRDNFGLHD